MYKLKEVNLKLNPNKCCFAAKSITFLGHVVSKEGTKLDLGKIKVVLHFPQPKTITNVRSFLGLTGYYRNYVRSYSRLAAPLFELTRKDVNFVWDMGCQQAFHELKAALVDAPILTQPDFKRTFCLDVDWSPKGIRAILSQKEGRFEKVVAYASKLNRSPEKIPSHGREVLRTNLGHHAFQAVFAQESFHSTHRLQASGVASHRIRCAWQERQVGRHVTRFQLQDNPPTRTQAHECRCFE